ncbi:hypothetical protein N7513_003193 [Penicillium frequentans]|nr:hypothetical protein N7513_003193 [Penicillium glabrum]
MWTPRCPQASCGQRRITTILRYAAAQELSLLLVLTHASSEISTLSVESLSNIPFDQETHAGCQALNELGLQYTLERKILRVMFE